jgi:hypothetical protein
MNNSRIRRIVTVAACAIALGLGVFATPSAASASPSSSGHAATAVVTPAVTFGCGSVPRFVSSNDGTFTGQGINIRSGPYTRCTPYGLGYRGQVLKVWCYYVNSNGSVWVYLNDRSTGVRGWSDAQFVTWVGFIPACTR